jgi:3-isopropylmalate/(R)-2-methylmalate dehydratase small subunit
VAGRSWPFDIGAIQKAMLVDGLDEMDLALRTAERTAGWERQDRHHRPWAWPALAGWGR